MSKSNIDHEDAETIVDIVRELRTFGVNNHRPTIRACIATARVLAIRGGHARADDPVFRWACRDILSTDTAKITRGGEPIIMHKVDEIVEQICGAKEGRRQRH